MAELKQLKVKAGVVRRVLKDLDYTKKETAAQAAKVESMKANQADIHDIRKQEEVLAECASHRPLDEDRLEAAIEDLTRLVNQCRDSPDFDDLKETEEFKAAELLLEESPTTST